MTKDIILSGFTHRGSLSSWTATMCISFKWMPHSQRLGHVLLSRLKRCYVRCSRVISVATGLMKELRCIKRVCLTENSATNAWNLNFNNGNFNNNNKTNENSVRPVSAFDRFYLSCDCALNKQGLSNRLIKE